MRLFRDSKKNSTGRTTRSTHSKQQEERNILNTVPSPNPDAPSNKANLEMNKAIKEGREYDVEKGTMVVTEEERRSIEEEERHNGHGQDLTTTEKVFGRSDYEEKRESNE